MSNPPHPRPTTPPRPLGHSSQTTEAARLRPQVRKVERRDVIPNDGCDVCGAFDERVPAKLCPQASSPLDAIASALSKPIGRSRSFVAG